MNCQLTSLPTSWIHLLKPTNFLLFVFHPGCTLTTGVDAYHISKDISEQDLFEILGGDYAVCGSCSVVTVNNKAVFCTSTSDEHEYILLCLIENLDLQPALIVGTAPVNGPILAIPKSIYSDFLNTIY